MSELMATRGQLRDMGMAFRRLGLNDRDEIMAYVWLIVGRDIESRKELTAREASLVLDAIEEQERFWARRRPA
jgi:hypothetical protein